VRRRVLWKGVAKLLCGPRRCRMRGDRHVDDPSAVVGEEDEHEEQPECHRRYDEEVGGHDLACVIGEKGAPRLRRWTRMPSDVFGNGGFTHHDS
jgi:hypothetical protein